MRYFVSGILLLIGLCAQAQTQRLLLSGKVMDATTGEALIAARITEIGAPSGTYSDSLGNFRLWVWQMPTRIRVGYLGYRTAEIAVPSADSLVVVRLEPKPVEIDGATITDKRPLPVLEDHTIHVHDYAFTEYGYLLVIVHDKVRRHSKMVLLDEADEPVAQHFGFGRGEVPGKFVVDCLDNIHYLTQHLACQVNFDEGALVVQKDSLATFQKVVAPCSGQLDDTYFIHHQLHPYVRQYTRLHVREGLQHAMLTVVDSQAIRQIADEARTDQKIVSPELLGKRSNTFAVAGRDSLDSLYLKSLMFPPLYAPLRIVNGRAVIFDHANGHIHHFDAMGQHIRQVPISYQKERHWQPNIFTDFEHSRVFAVFQRNGFATLREVDIHTGALKGSWEIPKQFATRLGVRGDAIFFLFKDSNYDPVNKLYRMEM